MKKLIGVVFAISTLLVGFSSLAAQKVTVFAAASLTNAMQDISKQYQADHKDTEIVFSFASSSVLARQIEQGAPVDIFMSADQKWMNYLLERDLTENKDTLLKNSLVLIAPSDSKLNHVTINKSTNWGVILPNNEKMAIGDPDHVPAGLYAKESLTNLGIFSKLEPQFARASNVRDALMLVERGEAVLGIVYSTDAKVSKKVKIVGEFPADTFKSIEYPVSLLNNTDSAKDFYDYLKTKQAKAIFQQYGFVTQ